MGSVGSRRIANIAILAATFNEGCHANTDSADIGLFLHYRITGRV